MGGLGFIGKHVVRVLSRSDTSLTVISDPETSRKSQAFVKEFSLHVEEADVQDRNRLTEIMLKEKPDAVVHLAALTGIARCEANPELAFSVNVLGAYNVIMGCVSCNCRLVFMSSREVYGESTSRPTTEDDRTVPNNIYGLTKLLAERLVLWAAKRHDLDFTILRLTNVYGPAGDQYNVQAMIQHALASRTIQLLGGSQQMNLIYVDDVAEVIRVSLANPNASRQTFNVGSYDNVTVEDLVIRIAKTLGGSITIERKSMRTGETINFRPNLAKLQQLIQPWHPTSLDDGLQKTVDWYMRGAR